MKTVSVLLALFGFAFAEMVLAAAVATSVTGNAIVQLGQAEPRALRTGDRVNQGETVVTGPASSAVLKFDDGQVAALTANSRMTITTYQYQRETQRGNVLLSLVRGGMRMVTGVIAKNNPENVAVRAASATIGIRGTDFTVITVEGVVYAHVDGGVISFTFNNQTVTIDTGRAVLTNKDGTVSQGTINEILAALRGAGPVGQQIADLLGGLTGLSNAINQAFPGTPTQGQGGPADTSPGTGTGRGVGTPTGPSGIGGGGGGGGTASPN